MKFLRGNQSLEAEAEKQAEALAKAPPTFNRAAAEADMTAVDGVKQVAIDNRIDIMDLPSQGIFYPSDEIAIRPFRFREYGSLSAAQASNSFRSLAEGVAPTILNFDGQSMTFEDFKYVMYRHRMQMNRPFDIEWTCRGEEHNEWIAQGWQPVDKSERFPDGKKPIDPRRIRQSKTFNKSKLVVVNPDRPAMEQIVDESCMIEEGLYLLPTSIRDVIAMEEARDLFTQKAADEDMDVTELQETLARMDFVNKYACILNPAKHGLTLDQRREFLDKWMEKLEEEQPDKVFTVLEKLEQFLVSSDHSVEEHVNVKCEVCGHEQDVEIVFSAADFFPRVQARTPAEDTV